MVGSGRGSFHIHRARIATSTIVKKGRPSKDRKINCFENIKIEEVECLKEKVKVCCCKLYDKSLNLFSGLKLLYTTTFTAFYISMLPFVDLSSHYQQKCNFHVNIESTFLDDIIFRRCGHGHNGNWWNFLMQFEGNQAKNGV
jgi:hypothetical protein